MNTNVRPSAEWQANDAEQPTRTPYRTNCTNDDLYRLERLTTTAEKLPFLSDLAFWYGSDKCGGKLDTMSREIEERLKLIAKQDANQFVQLAAAIALAIGQIDTITPTNRFKEVERRILGDNIDAYHQAVRAARTAKRDIGRTRHRHAGLAHQQP